ncbi:SDR family oxidoreductase [Streptomyces chartreusis]|uniref:SDR family oxidoreductase n=1 Tax=Streptomyces chartreusis TaxID=1969 RepID=UPI0036330D73
MTTFEPNRRTARTDFAGKRVLITGAARGLGLELATVLAARGARLSLVGLEPELLKAQADALGSSHTWFAADVTDQAALDDAVQGTVAALGGIDVVVPNAGIANMGTIASGPVDAHVRTIDVNVNGTIRTVSACLPHLIESRGYALLIASVGSFGMFPGLGTYCVSKAAVEHLANALRFELAHTGVAVGSAHPAFLNTDLVRGSDENSQSLGVARRRLLGPLSQTYSPRECAVALADGIAKRKRRVYVPRSLAVMQALRPLVLSSMGDAVLKRRLRIAEYIPALEDEVKAVGRAFGAVSVETKAQPGR